MTKLRKPALAILAAILITRAAAQVRTPQVLHTFTGGTDGAKLCGATANGGYLDNGTVFQFDLNTGRNTVLHTFTGGTADGAGPAGGLVRDSAGNLYGATRLGGARSC